MESEKQAEEAPKTSSFDAFISKIERQVAKAKQRCISLIYPSQMELSAADQDRSKISNKIQKPGPPPLSGGVNLLSSALENQKKQQEAEEAKKPKVIRGAFALVRHENAILLHDQARMSSFYKKVIASGVVLLFHSSVTLNFLYQARYITYDRFPWIFPRLQYIWYPTLIGTYVIFVFMKHRKLNHQLDAKYTDIWLEINEIYKEREREKQREKEEKLKKEML